VSTSAHDFYNLQLPRLKLLVVLTFTSQRYVLLNVYIIMSLVDKIICWYRWIEM